MAVAARDATEFDVGNSVLMEHLNLMVPDQLEATLFYIVGLGLTRDPYGAVGIDNMHVNVGDNQFHLPTRGTQVVAGHVGIVVPDIEALEKRLQAVQPRLAHTQLAWTREKDYLAVTCPWGNTLRCYPPSARFGELRLGMPYIEIQAQPNASGGIARFYDRVFRAPASVETDGTGPAAHVQIGRGQTLIFRETAGEIRPYDGYHIAIYVADFSGPYSYLKERGLLTEDIRNHQFRFQAIVDPDTGEKLHELEHEVRSLHHPQFRRVLVNRDAGSR
jgi:hypothetical protein